MDGEDAVGPLILVIRVHHVLLHAYMHYPSGKQRNHIYLWD